MNAQESKVKNKYKILSWNSAFEMIYEKGKFFENPTRVLKLEDNIEIYIYDLADKEFIVIPKYPNENFTRNEYPAFIYYDSLELEESISKQSFPIPYHFLTILDIEREKLKLIEKCNFEYINYFDSLMGTSFNKLIDFNELKKIHPFIKKKSKEIFFQKLLLSYSIVICKYLEIKKSAILSKVIKSNGYKSYYVPSVKIGLSELSPFEAMGKKELDAKFETFFIRVLLNARPILSEFQNKTFSEYFEYLKENNYF